MGAKVGKLALATIAVLAISALVGCGKKGGGSSNPAVPGTTDYAPASISAQAAYNRCVSIKGSNGNFYPCGSVSGPQTCSLAQYMSNRCQQGAPSITNTSNNYQDQGVINTYFNTYLRQRPQSDVCQMIAQWYQLAGVSVNNYPPNSQYPQNSAQMQMPAICYNQGQSGYYNNGYNGYYGNTSMGYPQQGYYPSASVNPYQPNAYSTYSINPYFSPTTTGTGAGGGFYFYY